MVKIACLGVNGKYDDVLRPMAERLSSEGHDISIIGSDSVYLDEHPEELPAFMEAFCKADFAEINIHGDLTHFKHYRVFMERVKVSNCSILLRGTEADTVAEYRHLFRQSDDDYNLLMRLESIGGDENHRTTLLWVLNTFGGEDNPLPDVVIPMNEGVYIPGKGDFTLEEGLKDVGSSGKPVVGVLFLQKYWLDHNTDFVDSIYRHLEEFGAEPVPVFVSSGENKVTGSMGIKRLVKEHLLRDGKPVFDSIIETMGFAQTVLAQPGTGMQVCKDNFFETMNVPVLQAINLYGPPSKWKNSPLGLTAADIAMSVVDPEYDGQIDGVPFGGSVRREDGTYHIVPIEDRCRMLAETAYLWAKLRHISVSERKVAILIYMYPPRQDLAGGGYGLDTPESVSNLLKQMSQCGYSLDWVPENGRELVDRLLAGITNDDSFITESQIREAAVDTVPKKTYLEWFSEIAESARKRYVEAWGEPPGDIHVSEGRLLLPGIQNGNVFIGFQPDRGKCTVDAYHDTEAAPPHQYLAFYRWLKYTWKADAVVHMGTHGTLEWLPGKGAGLSSECDPDIILGNLPNINPYIIDNPGEGMQAKRRSYAVVTTHMIPAMVRAGGYGRLEELESLVQTYLKAKEYGSKEKMEPVLERITSMCRELELDKDLGDDLSSDSFVDRLYDYLLDVKEAMIKDGLHILGEIPEGERLVETIYMLVRYRNGATPSLRESIAEYHGFDLETLLHDPPSVQPDGRIAGEIVDMVDDESYSLIEGILENGFDEEKSVELGHLKYPESESVEEVVRFICGFLHEAVDDTDDEIRYVLKALEGGFVPPGPSGCPGRGRAEILPTGKNFYSIEPDGIPWNSSWDIGSAMAEQMVQRYIEDNGTYPHNVGLVLWATDTMKTGGDDVAYILKLMGLRPVWDRYGGRVTGLEIIPISELGRPRIDVTVRISGLFRDTFPNISDLIDGGVEMIASLDEDEETNYLAANLRRDTVEAVMSGVPLDEARRAASIRIFGDAPGQYGSGISSAVETGKWETIQDLGEIYVKHGCYVYGKGLQGESRPDLFRKRLSVMDVTVKNHNTRAVDMLDMDDDFDMLGGLNSAVKAIRGKDAESYMGDSSDMQNLKLRTAREECAFIFRSKIDNPKWLEGLKKHGFAGAKELSKLFGYTIGWSATSDIVENWMYTDLAEMFVLDEETREWIKDENPYAMIEMVKRLDEANRRGFWDAPDDILEKMGEVYLEFEERIEEITDR